MKLNTLSDTISYKVLLYDKIKKIVHFNFKIFMEIYQTIRELYDSAILAAGILKRNGDMGKILELPNILRRKL